MAHVITDTCKKDNLCLDTCPSEAIRPSKDEAEWETVPQLYINPEECMDCGACVSVCPTNSIFPAEDLTDDMAHFAASNANYFKK
jgi:NAD-dependent dihydropyrimidine dehydrogenase PreA subunit